MITFQDLRQALQHFDEASESRRQQLIQTIIQEQATPLPQALTDRFNQDRFSHSEMKLLSYIDNHGGECSYQQLTQELELSQGMISRYVNRLTTNGLLEKFHRNGNKKSVYLKITPTGQRVSHIHLTMHRREDEYYNQILEKIDENDLQATLNILQKLS